jgi:hypothetical protein
MVVERQVLGIGLDPLDVEAMCLLPTRPRCQQSGVRSLAVTRAPRRAAGIDALPVPAATSSTRAPALMPAPSASRWPMGNRNVSTISG